MNYARIILFCLLLSSCGAKKTVQDAQRVKTVETVQVVRKADTISYVVPNFKIKDTTITTYNKNGSSARVVFDHVGNVESFDCYMQGLEMLLERIEKMEQTTQTVETKEGGNGVLNRIIIIILLTFSGGFGLIYYFKRK